MEVVERSIFTFVLNAFSKCLISHIIVAKIVEQIGIRIPGELVLEKKIPEKIQLNVGNLLHKIILVKVLIPADMPM